MSEIPDIIEVEPYWNVNYEKVMSTISLEPLK